MSNVKVFFAGDFCSLVPADDIKLMPELESLIKKADISVCNFETPVKPSNYDLVQDVSFTKLYQSSNSVSFLEKLGFNLFSLANNHTFDCGDEGFHETVSHMIKAQGIGAGSFADAYKVKLIEKDGIKIGFLALTYASFGVFDNSCDGSGLGCAYINHPCVNHIIQNAKKSLDILIVLAHDGIEYTDAPTHFVISRYHDLIDYGADAVVACHPHCPQGWEEYKGHPIFYSLGNFFFNSKSDPEFRTQLPFWYNGLVVVLQIDTETKLIKYDVVNTIVDGRSISIDKTEGTNKRNSYLCNLVNNEIAFNEYWDTVIPQLFKEKYMPFCEQTFGMNKRPKGIHRILKWLFKLLIQNNVINYKRFLFIIRSDTERDLFVRGLRRANAFN